MTWNLNELPIIFLPVHHTPRSWSWNLLSQTKEKVKNRFLSFPLFNRTYSPWRCGRWEKIRLELGSWTFEQVDSLLLWDGLEWKLVKLWDNLGVVEWTGGGLQRMVVYAELGSQDMGIMMIFANKACNAWWLKREGRRVSREEAWPWWKDCQDSRTEWTRKGIWRQGKEAVVSLKANKRCDGKISKLCKRQLNGELKFPEVELLRGS